METQTEKVNLVIALVTTVACSGLVLFWMFSRAEAPPIGEVVLTLFLLAAPICSIYFVFRFLRKEAQSQGQQVLSLLPTILANGYVLFHYADTALAYSGKPKEIIAVLVIPGQLIIAVVVGLSLWMIFWWKSAA